MAIVANEANEANKAIVANKASDSDNEVAGVLDNHLGLNFMDNGLGGRVDEFDKLVVVEAKQRRDAAKGFDEAEGQVVAEFQVAAKGRYAEAKEVRGNVVAKGHGVSEEANRLCTLPFSLTKYSAILWK